ncbi:MAG: terpene cyclase/mutase family protein [Anaerotruncus sp.]|nr:terpene cyclase/mutase family protein [Anaerotruncus sp.]
MRKRIFAASLGVWIFCCVAVPVFAQEHPVLEPFTDQSWRYLEENEPAQWSILAYSLGGRPVRKDAKQQLSEAVSNGYTAATELEQQIIGLVKSGENPYEYQKKNLLGDLYQYGNLYADGLSGAIGALAAYQAADAKPSDTTRNYNLSVVEYIVNSQQRSGGFAPVAGHDPNICVTAQAVAVLVPYQEIGYVRSAVERAVNWLISQQNPDGSFSTQGQPSSEATSHVLIAMAALGNTSDTLDQFPVSPLDGLLSFRNVDGGYRAFAQQPSSVAATELAAVALYALEDGLSPYLPLTAYPGYVEPKQDALRLYGRFVAGFCGVFALVYLILISTPKIAAWIDQQRAKRDAEDAEIEAEDLSPYHTQTMEIHIPMQAEMPDFDTISEQDTSSFGSQEQDKGD